MREELTYMRTMTSAFPWTKVKWRSKEEQRIQTLDLALKILVPLILSACLVISLKVGSFNGYLQLLSRQSFRLPPDGPGGWLYRGLPGLPAGADRAVVAV